MFLLISIEASWNIEKKKSLRMVITKNTLINLLNMDLELEYAATIQYINHASLLMQKIPYRKIAREVTQDALEEAQHAVMLAGQIARLGGVPSVRVARIFVCPDEQQMLEHDLDDKQDSIRRYQLRAEQAEQLQEFDLAQQLQYMLEMEQEHKLDFRYHQSIRKRERELPIADITEQGCFSEKWQERAMHVPIRTKLM